MSSAEPQAGGGRRIASAGGRQRFQHVAGGAAIALVVVFAIVNLNDVSVDWIVTTTQTSLTVVIVISFLVGAVAGAALWRRRTKP